MAGVPELPDITVYLHGLESRILHRPLESARIISPFFLRTTNPSLNSVVGMEVTGLRRLGKRIVFELGDDTFLVFHLMIAGRFRWSEKTGAKPPGKIGLAAFDFPSGTLLVTEASSRKRASLHAAGGEAELAAHNPGGMELLECRLSDFRRILALHNHSLKRFLTDPRLVSGVGNAYSDEILHSARLSPFQMSPKLTPGESRRLFDSCRSVLRSWIDRLLKEFADKFPGPGDVTAFRPEFAVHGQYGKQCPECGTTVQRVRYASNEMNYCPRCQAGGKIYADRSLSKLLKDDWPRTIEELEELKTGR